MSFFGSKSSGDHASQRRLVPAARSENLIVEHVGEELLVYDERAAEAHCLTPLAASVWQACDGTSTVEQVSQGLGIDRGFVLHALEELSGKGLLDEPAGSSGITRREVTARMAKVGAVAASAPLIYSILSPTPALAASQNFCLGLGCQGTGCDVCYKNGCACCGEGTSGSTKLCTSDCTCTNCKPSIIHAHCGGTGTSSGCTSGPNHLPNTQPCTG